MFKVEGLGLEVHVRSSVSGFSVCVFGCEVLGFVRFVGSGLRVLESFGFQGSLTPATRIMWGQAASSALYMGNEPHGWAVCGTQRPKLRVFYNAKSSVVLYCNFRSLAFLGLLGFLIRQPKS